MKVLVILVLLVVVAFGIGWITMQRDGKSVDIRINTEKVESDTEKVVDGAKDIFRKDSEPVTVKP